MTSTNAARPQASVEANPKIDPAPNSNTEKEPSDWVSGNDPVTGAQASYLKTLSEECGEQTVFNRSSPRLKLQNRSMRSRRSAGRCNIGKPAMRRAFIKEAESATAELSARPISPHLNFVTEAGLAAIEGALGRFEAVHRAASDKGDREAAAAALREAPSWQARRASAEVVKPPPDKRRACFGMTVTLHRHDEQSFRIVGEDEADPPRGTVSYVSPLARAVLTHGPGDTVEIAGWAAVILDVR